MTIFGRELTLEQVIGFVECNASPDEDLVHRAALELIAALRESFGAQPEVVPTFRAEPNTPLTLDELRGWTGRIKEMKDPNIEKFAKCRDCKYYDPTPCPEYAGKLARCRSKQNYAFKVGFYSLASKECYAPKEG